MRAPLALALACATASLFPAPGRAQAASLAGIVRVALGSLSLADVAPAVVYLEAIDAPPPSAPRRAAELRQHSARFLPEFLVVAVGQPIEMPNDDTIFHNVFSYSRPNDFDLGLYRSGESRTLRFDHAGPVRLYCSIHERMNGLIFVAPTRLFALPAPNGAFRIEDVPAGRYRLRVWTERLPAVAREVSLAAGERARVELALGALGG